MGTLNFNTSLLSHLVPNIFITIIIAFLIICLVSIFFRWLWNTTMPELFNLKEITLGQSIKILVMAWILFGHFGR